MYSVNGNNIYLTRGDYLCIELDLSRSGNAYVPQSGDSIRFAVKRTIKDRVPIFTKDIPIDTLRLELDPSDTKLMNFGTYKYDMEFRDGEGRVDTFLLGNFIITEEVH